MSARGPFGSAAVESVNVYWTQEPKTVSFEAKPMIYKEKKSSSMSQMTRT